MPGLTIHSSNRLENLAEQLAESLRKPLPEPFAKEIIVVQSGGMARWITHEIAHRNGIAMNIECPFPREFAGRVLRAVFPKMQAADGLAPDALAWRTDRMLPALVKKSAFAEVRSYLEKGDDLKRLQFAEKIAHCFDQYLVYRPEMLMEWERGAGRDDWQAILWRELCGGEATQHLAAIHEQLDCIGRADAAPLFSGDVPERVSIFGVSSLPPFYLRVFFELSRHRDVHLFSLQPASEYFGHDLPPKQRAKLLARLAKSGGAVSAELIPEGNPLLASMGRLHRDFIELHLDIDERCGHIAREAEHFEEPKNGGILHAIQRDIFAARVPDAGEKFAAGADDYSIAIHSCHSPMREVEVLHDQLLAMFDADATLRPRDVMVLTPDIEKYAPFVQAVFDCPEDESRRIPFSIADRHPRNANAAVETFLALLGLAESRCTASEIFALLERDAIRRRFDFTAADLEVVRGWIAESGIRWGIDGAHREAFGLPALDGNTWRSGLDRLLLGFAMDGHDTRMFEGIMPLDGVEGSRAELLGRFLSSTDAMFRLVNDTPTARPLAAWPSAFGTILDDFFPVDDADVTIELRAIRAAIERLRQLAEITRDAAPVAFRVVRHQLESLLDSGEHRGGFLSGRVTFCALKPDRSIPALAVCLLGMDDAAFPRQSRPPAFDKISAAPRCGDRSVRDEDRAMFLEVILSARDRLYISFLGRSAIDNKETPPSVVVSELLDYLDRACEFAGEKSARDFVITRHPLHAFSPLYFSRESARHFSYSQSNAAASRSLLAPPQPVPEFLAVPLAESSASRIVVLCELIDFFANPAKQFVRDRLGIKLDERDDTLEDAEVFNLGNLDRYKLQQEIAARTLARESVNERAFAARGLIPLGDAGVGNFHALRVGAEGFCARVESLLTGKNEDEPLALDIRVGEFSLTGKIEPMRGGALAQFRCADLKPKDWLRAWIAHLALCASDTGKSPRSILIGKESVIEFRPVENAAALLEKLLVIHRCGLTRPLKFFPKSSFEFADAKLNPGRGKTSPLDRARKKWEGRSDENDGEKHDANFKFCFDGSDPLDEDFADLALEVFGPMIEHAEEIE